MSRDLRYRVLYSDGNWGGPLTWHQMLRILRWKRMRLNTRHPVKVETVPASERPTVTTP